MGKKAPAKDAAAKKPAAKKPAAKKPAKKPDPQAGLKVCPECGGDVRLLKSTEPRHIAVMEAGYTRYCVKCEEVFK